MTAYADTGFLCSLYAPDMHTGRAVARMRRQALPLPLTWLHHVEFRNAPPLGEILTEAERLSAVHTEKLGARSQDILHVSSALVLRFPVFLAFDHRRIALAKATGLNVSAL